MNDVDVRNEKQTIFLTTYVNHQKETGGANEARTRDLPRDRRTL